MVTSSTFHCPRSIAPDSSRYGAPGAKEEEVAQAAAVAHIHDAITTSFKKGYDTRVGTCGLCVQPSCAAGC